MKSGDASSVAVDDEVSLLSLPPSVFLFHLCTFLPAFDLLSLRLTSNQIHNLLHKEGDDSEQIWQKLLQRDFGLESSIQKTPGWNQVLNMKFPSPQIPTLFGVDPADEQEFLLSIETGAFDVWRYWLKADLRILAQRNSPLRESGSTFIHAPYFLRAARFWKRLLKWCDAQGTSNIGQEIRASLGTAFDGYERLTTQLASSGGRITKTSCQMAVLAVYAFSSGQGVSFRNQTPFDGLLGGYHAYGYYSSMCLVKPNVIDSNHLKVAADLIGQQQRIPKSVSLDLMTGKLMWDGQRVCFSSPGDDPHGSNESSSEPPQKDDFLNWLEEYVRRLTSGIYRVENLGGHPSDPDAITLFPQPPTTPGSPPLPLSCVSSVPVVSRAVSRGVEAVGSAVFAPQGGQRFGFIYCIRLRLLQPGEDGYQTESERGFASCQLQSRHWRITNDQTGHTDSVDGQGVIGMYPLLREGRYSIERDYAQFTEGTFYYQSCTGHVGRTGSFGGQIGFVPGSLLAPTGPSFMVELAPFLLDSRPNYLY